MIARLMGLAALFYAFGFVAFVLLLPAPLAEAEAEAVIVPTGGAGRIARGLKVLRGREVKQMFVSGVDPDVKPGEFAAEFGVTRREMQCCVTLGFLAVDTHSNAGEAREWVVRNEFKSVRLVTSDWHLRRTLLEFRGTMPDDVSLIGDAVPTTFDFGTLFLEYNKLLAVATVQTFDLSDLT